MTTVNVARLHARYEHVDAAQAKQFDKALADMANRSLDGQISHLISRPEFAICIQTITIPVQLDADKPVGALALEWGQFVAEAIAAQVEAADPVDTIVYRRETDAIADMVRSVTHGDLVRSWAWKQVGLTTTPSPTINDVVVALARRSDLLPSVLAMLDNPWDLPFSPHQWHSLAGGYARLFGVDQQRADAADPGDQPASSLVQAGWSTHPRLIHVWRDSREAERADLVSLLLSLLDPQFVKVQSHRSALARHLDRASSREQTKPLHAAPSSDEAGTEPTAVEGESPPLAEANGDGTGPDAARASALSKDDPRSADPSTDEQSTHDRGAAVPTDTAQSARDAHAHADHGDETGADTDLPGLDLASDDRFTAHADKSISTAQSDQAGVLFLIRVLDELRVPDQLQQSAREAELPAVLLAHVVSRSTGVSIHDAAVRTVAGIDPTSDDHAAGLAALLTQDQQRRVVASAKIVTAWLDEHVVSEPGDTAPQDRSWMWSRFAQIEWSAGWIEAELSVESVDLRIRREGLDLDPGFVWWLGAVVRFRYV